MPRWPLWIAGVFVVRGIWEAYSPIAAVIVGVGLFVGLWAYRIVEQMNESPGHRAHAARRELRRLAGELGEAILGWGLILLALFGIGVLIATWPPNWWLVGLVVVLCVLGIVVLVASFVGLSNVVDGVRSRRWGARRAQLEPVLEAWEASLLSTSPTDRAAVERIVASVYRRRRRAGSPTIDWAASPLEFVRLLRQADSRPRLHRPPPMWFFLILPFGQNVGLWGLIWDAAGHGQTPRDEVEAALAATIGADDRDLLVAQTNWFSFRKGHAIVLEHPLEIQRDADGELHNATGPAARFADGWCVWALHGVVVPGEAIEDPESFDPLAALRHENVEVRRVLLDHLGWDRVIEAADLEPQVEDDHGRLWHLPMRDGDPVLLLEVENATPDHDGTHRRYFLRVPPDMKSPREATAWTFGLSELEYAPEMES